LGVCLSDILGFAVLCVLINSARPAMEAEECNSMQGKIVIAAAKDRLASL